jgi:NAD(P)-dependent dehydrogenase (short-subunit alcohol dehydrogenase family)
MSKTIVVVGYGPGISSAVAERFGQAGFSVALVARNRDRLEAGVSALKKKGIAAAAFPADAGDPAAIRTAFAKVRAELSDITVLHWNAISGAEAGDLLAAEADVLRGVFDVAVFGLLAAIREALPDLKQTKGALLVTNGAFGEPSPAIDALAANMKFMGVALANAAKFKLVGLLAELLKPQGIYVGEVMVAGIVKGTPFASAEGGIEPSAIAAKFWELFESRDEIRARVT